MYFLNRFNHSVYNQGQIQSKSYYSVNNNIGTLYHKDDYYYNSNVLDSLIESEYFSWGTYFDRKNIYYHTPFGTTVSLVRQAIENPNAVAKARNSRTGHCAPGREALTTMVTATARPKPNR